MAKAIQLSLFGDSDIHSSSLYASGTKCESGTEARRDKCFGRITGAGRGKEISRGDRVFARLQSGASSVELSADRIGSLRELTAEIRRAASAMRGLATLYVRNLSQGWSLEKPLYLRTATI